MYVYVFYHARRSEWAPVDRLGLNYVTSLLRVFDTISCPHLINTTVLLNFIMISCRSCLSVMQSRECEVDGCTEKGYPNLCREHTNPYKCAFCSKGFNSVFSKKQHELRQHTATEEERKGSPTCSSCDGLETRHEPAHCIENMDVPIPDELFPAVKYICVNRISTAPCEPGRRGHFRFVHP